MRTSSTIHRGDWKLICHHGNQRFKLFNLANDLGETTNLAEQEPGCVREPAAELSKILHRYEVPMPLVKATGKPQSSPDARLRP